MYHVRAVLEDEWMPRKAALGKDINTADCVKKGIERYEQEKAKKERKKAK
jgi:hypothetical protein